MPKRNKTPSNSTTLPSKRSRTDDSGTSKGKNAKHDTHKSPKEKAEKSLLDPRLKCIKRLVEAQTTDDFQSILFSFAEKNFLSLMQINCKEKGIAKFGGDDNFIPGSLDFKPKLTLVEALKNDESTIKALNVWEDKILHCKKELAIIVQQQAERNLSSMILEHEKDVMRTMLEIGTIVAQKEKISRNLH